MADNTVDLTVSAPFQVVLDGKAYAPGETVSAPPAIATQWINYGWATEAQPTSGK